MSVKGKLIWNNIDIEFHDISVSNTSTSIKLLVLEDAYLKLRDRKSEIGDLIWSSELTQSANYKNCKIEAFFKEVRIGTRDTDFIEVWFKSLSKSELRDYQTDKLLNSLGKNN